MFNFFLGTLLFFAGDPTAGKSSVGGRTSPDGAEEIQIDLPGQQHLKNSEGKDGLGLCVFTSVEHAARWQNTEAVAGFQKKMRLEPGGGWPDKLAAMMDRHCSGAPYLQYEGHDPGLIRLAIDTGRMPAITYGFSPRYGGRVAHMVNLVHLTDRWACVLDNNFPGDTQYEWMTPAELSHRWTMGGGGWAVLLLSPPPPPIPANTAPRRYQALTRPWSEQCWGQAPSPPVGGALWSSVAGHPEQFSLVLGGKQLGIWDRAKARWFPLRADGTWEDGQAEPPEPLPENLRKPKPDPATPSIKNYGVDNQRISLLEKFLFNGSEISKDQARRLLAPGQDDGKLVDDRAKLRVTVIGTREDCDRVAADFSGSADLADWKKTVLVQCYRPDDWAVVGLGFAPGTPRIVVQAGPDKSGQGQVVHSQADYAGGSAELAGALRKARPDYDPKKDPDRRKTADVESSAPKWLSLLAALVAGALAARGMPFLAAAVRALPSLLPVLTAPKPPQVPSELAAILADMHERLKRMESPSPAVAPVPVTEIKK